MASSARASASLTGTPLAFNPAMTFSQTVSQGNRAKVWKTIATPSVGPSTGSP